MPETKQQDTQQVTRPALKPFVKPSTGEAQAALRLAAPVFGRVTLPPFGPIRYGGPKPGAAIIAHDEHEDEDAPNWASIEPAPDEVVAEEVVVVEEPIGAVEPSIEELAAEAPSIEELGAEAPSTEELGAEAPSIDDLAAEPLAADPVAAEALVAEPPADEPVADEPWMRAPEPEPLARRPVLPLTGPNDPTPIVNQTIERTTDPHRMTPMRVTPLRPSLAVPPPSALSPFAPSYAAPSQAAIESNARAVAAALEMVAARVRRGDLVVPGSVPASDDPPALAAALAATLAALLGVRS
jgi:hypothetical protein